MEQIPWPTAGITFALTACLLFVFHGTGPGWASALVAVLAALATCLGAVFAPATYGAPALSPAQGRARKRIQLVAAGCVTLVAANTFIGNAGTAAIFGIAAALFIGAVLPRKHAEHGSPTSE